MIADNADDLITSFEQASNSLFEWYKNNLLNSNADKCHMLVSTNDRVSMNVGGFKIDKSDTEKLLGVRFDKKLTFEIISVTSVKKQIDKYLLWPELHHTWDCEETHTHERFFLFAV